MADHDTWETVGPSAKKLFRDKAAAAAAAKEKEERESGPKPYDPADPMTWAQHNKTAAAAPPRRKKAGKHVAAMPTPEPPPEVDEGRVRQRKIKDLRVEREELIAWCEKLAIQGTKRQGWIGIAELSERLAAAKGFSSWNKRHKATHGQFSKCASPEGRARALPSPTSSTLRTLPRTHPTTRCRFLAHSSKLLIDAQERVFLKQSTEAGATGGRAADRGAAMRNLPGTRSREGSLAAAAIRWLPRLMLAGFSARLACCALGLPLDLPIRDPLGCGVTPACGSPFACAAGFGSSDQLRAACSQAWLPSARRLAAWGEGLLNFPPGAIPTPSREAALRIFGGIEAGVAFGVLVFPHQGARLSALIGAVLLAATAWAPTDAYAGGSAEAVARMLFLLRVTLALAVQTTDWMFR
jgi:hypothetical protein